MFERDVTVRSVYEPLRACPSEANAAEMAGLLDERGFDVAGVKEPDSQAITHFVTAEVLHGGGQVGDYRQPIAVGELIAEATPLAQLFPLLGNRPYAFVLVGAAVAGIITRADLNKPPARIYLFALVSLLEMHLLFWVRKEFGDAWPEHLKPARLADAQRIYQLRREKGHELNLCDCLQICDKAALIMKQADLRQMFGVETASGGAKTFRRIQSLRDQLAHGQANLIQGTTWEELSEIVAWMERGLAKSDIEIEKLANESGANYVDKLWSASGTYI